MVALRKWMYIWIAVCIAGALTIVPPRPAHAQGDIENGAILIQEWQMRWEQPGEELTIEEVNAAEDGWFTVRADGEYPVVPEGVYSAWIKMRLPELSQMRPAILLSNLLSRDVSVFVGHNAVYTKTRNYSFVYNEIIIPLANDEAHQVLYIKLLSSPEKVGPQQSVSIGEYSQLIKKQIKKDLLDIILGASLMFISFFMLISVLFLQKTFLPGWNSLFITMLSIGVMILSYSSFLEDIFSEYGFIFYHMFDVASALLIPSLFIFFEKIFGKGPLGLISKFKWMQLVFSTTTLSLLTITFFFDNLTELYTTVGTIALGIAIVLGNIILILSLVSYCFKGNKDAVILSIGFGMFAGTGVLEIMWYFISDKMYKMFFWKISILFFLAALIIILVRKSMNNYEQAVQYSKQIEIFNNELQRTEKIEMISHLAASIAHEVRNPLQVTRGFLQLLSVRVSGEKDKSYMLLAIDELDRASEIITDFLTFAKPDLGEVNQLNVAEEIQQTVAILAPLALMQGGTIKTNIQADLFVRGNSSKFKQALINIIKNGIEAFKENGLIEIEAYENKEIVVIIRDNGEGMNEEDLKRLGEPYYSKKTKGTGLGLMVTYRIIEAMQGSIKFSSVKGEGTEVSIYFPRLNNNSQ